MTDYQRGTYTLARFEVVAPHVCNDGSASGYPAAFRAALTRHGIDGWSEFESVGYWQGKRERNVTFVIYSEALRDDHVSERKRATVDILLEAARACMPDQDAIQVVQYPLPVTLREA